MEHIDDIDFSSVEGIPVLECSALMNHLQELVDLQFRLRGMQESISALALELEYELCILARSRYNVRLQLFSRHVDKLLGECQKDIHDRLARGE